MQTPHIPVMLPEVLHALSPKDGEVYIDATFGAGGYTRAILSEAECRVYAIDRDPSTSKFAEQLTEQFGGRFCYIVGNFADMIVLLAEHGITNVDGVVFDLGISSMQIDEAERGFSFGKDGPLDMRMGDDGMSAADLVNKTSETELANIIYQYGEERASRKIAKAIVKARGDAPIQSTKQLADIIHGVLGRRHDQKTSPATKTFQALRIAVNDELTAVERGLEAAQAMLKKQGRLVVVTFHSLEDRMVKQYFKSRSGETLGGSRHLPFPDPNQAKDVIPPLFFLPERKAVKPSEIEVKDNPRARSAKLRVGIKT